MLHVSIHMCCSLMNPVPRGEVGHCSFSLLFLPLLFPSFFIQYFLYQHSPIVSIFCSNSPFLSPSLHVSLHVVLPSKSQSSLSPFPSTIWACLEIMSYPLHIGLSHCEFSAVPLHGEDRNMYELRGIFNYVNRAHALSQLFKSVFCSRVMLHQVIPDF